MREIHSDVPGALVLATIIRIIFIFLYLVDERMSNARFLYLPLIKNDTHNHTWELPMQYTARPFSSYLQYVLKKQKLLQTLKQGRKFPLSFPVDPLHTYFI